MYLASLNRELHISSLGSVKKRSLDSWQFVSNTQSSKRAGKI